jgi:hypothetical protein
MLTSMPRQQVASILTQLVEPIATVNADRHAWAPAGFLHHDEAQLGKREDFLTLRQCQEVTDWWLKIADRANTPNWDLVSQCDIGGRPGLILVEAKAHTAEPKREGKPKGQSDNDDRIEKAIRQANLALNRILAGWELTKDSHYQLCNRFAWTWKLATMDIPTILVYLGFLHCDEMSDQGVPFNSSEDWERVLREHADSVVPPNAWGVRIPTSPAPIWALIRSLDMQWEVQRH